MTRNEAIKAINTAIIKKYGREKMSQVCEGEGWYEPEISRALNKKYTTSIPKKLLQFAGLEIVKEATYQRTEK